MKFKSFIGKQVMTKVGIVKFEKEEYETDCEVEIKSLQNAKNVTQVKKGKQPKED